MRFLRHQKKRLFFYLTGLAAFIVIFFIAGKYPEVERDSDNLINRINEKIKEKDHSIINYLNNFRSEFFQYPDSLNHITDEYEELFKSNGFIFLLLRNDTLIYWSNNTISFTFLNSDTIYSVVNTGNAWYRVISQKEDPYTFFGMYLIKNQYSYENEYLTNSFHPSFSIPVDADIVLNRSDREITSSDGTFLFSIILKSVSGFTDNYSLLLFFIFLFSLLSFIGILYEGYLWLYHRTGNHILFIACFIIDLFIIRAVLFYLKFPRKLFMTDLFSPKFYAFSDLLPSIGDLFLNVVFLLIISFFLFNHIKFNQKYLRRNLFYKPLLIFSLFLNVFIFFNGITFIFETLIIDSSISLDLNNIFSLNQMSGFSFIIISSSILTFFLITIKLSYFAIKYSSNITQYIIIAFIVLIISIIICILLGRCDYLIQTSIFIYLLSFWFFYHYGKRQLSFPVMVFYILFFSVISTYLLHKFNVLKEQETRKFIAANLLSEQHDPVAEFLIKEVTDHINSDSLILRSLDNYNSDVFDENTFKEHIQNRYLTGYLKKFNQQVTICDQEDNLMVQPGDVSINCRKFFNSLISDNGQPTDNENLFLMNYAPGENGYLAVFYFHESNRKGTVNITVYIELTPKYLPQGLGFPDLLVDRKVVRTPDLSNYSYAKYENGELVSRAGNFFYTFNISNYGIFTGQNVFFDNSGYNHLYHKAEGGKAIIIGTRHKSLIDILAPFSYFFLSFLVFALTIYFLFIQRVTQTGISLNFRARLQISMASVILFSFFVIGLFTIVYIYDLNTKKNSDLISEKTHSVMVELQHKFPDNGSIKFESSEYLNELLLKFSNVFFTDINLYNSAGDLISSSRPQIFEKDLLGRKMNATAFRELTYRKSSFFIQSESIGKQTYLSTYIPIFFGQNSNITYLNLPYFAKENDLRREISNFLVAYINIYVILLAFSILISLAISNYIARPIKLIMTKIRQVRLGSQNEKIQLLRDDEIGELVIEYNRMIDALAQSADILAKSERESAWREMARQVAHEIKNPLTPMKLSVQYLRKAWGEKTPDWDQRLEKFTQTMIEQIETLSAIASAFSDFAKMPQLKKEQVNIKGIIEKSIGLFVNYSNIHFILNIESAERLIILADKEQLLRAFNNLLKNAVQAIGEDDPGKVEIVVRRINQRCQIEITDSGKGIPSELADKIFFPNFTTKSGGMGLGLAIVKSIVDNASGEISFVSKEEKGTTFILIFPLIEN